MLIPLFAAMILTCQTTAPAVTEPAAEFPAAWFGRWRGTCTYAPVKGPAKSFVMELNIAPTDDSARFKWEIVYVDGGQRQVRPYELLVVDAAKGEYRIDEKNSIVIDSTFIDGALYSQFDVMAVRVTASYRLDGERIIVELITTDPKQPKQTGGAAQTPAVTAYPARGVQRAVLTKQ